MSRSWIFLLDQAAAYDQELTEYKKVLSLQVSTLIMPASSFITDRLAFKTRAVVTINEDPNNKMCLVINGNGTFRQIQKLKEEVVNLIYNGRAASYGSMYGSSAAFFVEGSAYLFCKDAGIRLYTCYVF
jgi:hypothetical protein